MQLSLTTHSDENLIFTTIRHDLVVTQWHTQRGEMAGSNAQRQAAATMARKESQSLQHSARSQTWTRNHRFIPCKNQWISASIQPLPSHCTGKSYQSCGRNWRSAHTPSEVSETSSLKMESALMLTLPKLCIPAPLFPSSSWSGQRQSGEKLIRVSIYVARVTPHDQEVARGRRWMLPNVSITVVVTDPWFCDS